MGQSRRLAPVRRTELLRDLDRETGWVLLVEGVEQSYVDVADHTHLEFEYMQHMALVIDAVFARPRRLRAVHLGGGALTMPRWVEATRPGSSQVVAEVDPEVVDAVASLGSVRGCAVTVGDAAAMMRSLPSGSYDLVLWDLYDGPRAVMSTLALDAVVVMTALLHGDAGAVVMNVSDVAPFDVVRPVLAALRQTCRDVAMLAEPATLRGRRSGNCVLAGSVGKALPVDRLARVAAAAPVRARVVAGPDLDAFVGDARPGTVDAPLPSPDESSGRGFL